MNHYRIGYIIISTLLCKMPFTFRDAEIRNSTVICDTKHDYPVNMEKCFLDDTEQPLNYSIDIQRNRCLNSNNTTTEYCIPRRIYFYAICAMFGSAVLFVYGVIDFVIIYHPFLHYYKMFDPSA